MESNSALLLADRKNILNVASFLKTYSYVSRQKVL